MLIPWFCTQGVQKMQMKVTFMLRNLNIFWNRALKSAVWNSAGRGCCTAVRYLLSNRLVVCHQKETRRKEPQEGIMGGGWWGAESLVWNLGRGPGWLASETPWPGLVRRRQGGSRTFGTAAEGKGRFHDLNYSFHLLNWLVNSSETCQ